VNFVDLALVLNMIKIKHKINNHRIKCGFVKINKTRMKNVTQKKSKFVHPYEKDVKTLFVDFFSPFLDQSRKEILYLFIFTFSSPQ
jgi:hypothetical protein